MTSDFSRLLQPGHGLITISVLYWMPDYRHLLNEFVWQTIDIRPHYPRINRFLDHWRREIDAKISEIRLTDGELICGAEMRMINGLYVVN